jgi:hypothetical protein
MAITTYGFSDAYGGPNAQGLRATAVTGNVRRMWR